MSTTFNAEEIFEIARIMERNGAAYYRKAAGVVDQPEHGALLEQLAEMEDSHLRTFTEMKAAIGEGGAGTFEAGDLDALYLQLFADGVVFDPEAEPARQLVSGQSIQEILHKAIEMEQDSIAFYTGLLDMVPEKFGRGKIRVIIREEKRHAVDLAARLGAMKRPHA